MNTAWLRSLIRKYGDLGVLMVASYLGLHHLWTKRRLLLLFSLLPGMLLVYWLYPRSRPTASRHAFLLPQPSAAPISVPVPHDVDAPIDQQADQVYALAWSPDGKTLASGGDSATVTVWDSHTRKPRLRLINKEDKYYNVFALAYSPNGKLLAVGGGDLVTVWSSATGKVWARFWIDGGSVQSIAWSPSGKELSVDSELEISLLDIVHKRSRLTLEDHEYVPIDENYNSEAQAWKPDGRILANGLMGKVVLWDTATGRRRAELKRKFDVHALAWHPDGIELAVGGVGNNEMAFLWNPVRRTLVPLKGHHDVVEAMAWSPDGRRLATASQDGTVILWNAQGRRMAVLRGHSNTIKSLAWSPDGKTLATGSWDDTAILWNAATGKMLARLVGHSEWITTLAWCPNGNILATGSDDGSIKLWRRATGQLLTTLYLGE